ncbi:short-chain dehydrogenase/reductase [Streptomyces spiralis]|uniref:short-chain dehydrogenase/reductase n=1 Tax=Streptomyces sp. NRRL S-813 TaxID=1463919 RepID=UPI0004BE543A|nr:short-chain dehydrogenase/reductase [Streptomyces sp. NRRL S-813]
MTGSPLRGRTVVITGAARGLGAALAHELARREARLALLGHEAPGLDALATSLPTATMAIEVDVTDPCGLDDAASAVRGRLGRPSAVVANAGIAEGGPFATSDPASWRRVVDVNLTGSAQTARAFLPDLTVTAGYFLQIASLASLGATPMMSAYCASKAGVEAFAHALQAEVAHEGVAVGVAYPAWADTDMIREAEGFAALHELRAHMPPGVRNIRPADVVAARLARAVERRSTAVYIPAWLRLLQPLRWALPPVVLRLARRDLPRWDAGRPLRATGRLGAGGRADRAAAAPDDGRPG